MKKVWPDNRDCSGPENDPCMGCVCGPEDDARFLHAWAITKERVFALDALEGAIRFVVERTGQPLAKADQAVIRTMIAEARGIKSK